MRSESLVEEAQLTMDTGYRNRLGLNAKRRATSCQGCCYRDIGSWTRRASSSKASKRFHGGDLKYHWERLESVGGLETHQRHPFLLKVEGDVSGAYKPVGPSSRKILDQIMT